MVPRAAAVIAISVAGASAANGQELIDDFGGVNRDRFGMYSRRISDLDGDGVSDFLIGAYYGKGELVVVSGATRSVLACLVGEGNYDYFSKAAPAGDLDGDGVEDFGV